MTKSPINYKNGRIYIIRNTKNDKVYVGSTTQSLSKRFSKHKGEINSQQKSNYSLYKTMREIGVEYFYIEIIEMFPCDSKEELHSREGHWIRHFQSDEKEKGYNVLVAGRGYKEYYQDNRKRVSKYCKDRYASNKEAILAQMKEFRDNNKTLIKERKRLYREKYKDEINARQREKVVCECGSQVSRVHLSRHRSSKLHQDCEKSKPT